MTDSCPEKPSAASAVWSIIGGVIFVAASVVCYLLGSVFHSFLAVVGVVVFLVIGVIFIVGGISMLKESRYKERTEVPPGSH